MKPTVAQMTAWFGESGSTEAVAQILFYERYYFAQQIVYVVQGVDLEAELFPSLPLLVAFWEQVKVLVLLGHHFDEPFLDLLEGLVACGEGL